MGIFNIYGTKVILNPASVLSEKLEEAEALAKQKKLAEAIAIAQEILDFQSSVEVAWSKILLGNSTCKHILSRTKTQVNIWQKRLEQGKKYFHRGIKLESQPKNDPWSIEYLYKAEKYCKL